jgi:hypothetical protein
MITKGTAVKIKPEWQDKGDDSIVFVAVEDSSDNRVTIEALIGLSINPQYRVNIEMLEINPN